MHVAHVSGGKVASTPTTAGDVDLLALVLGGTAAADGVPFPATLEAAIADGAPHDADDGATSGDGAPTPGESDPALTLAAALAGSLAVEEPRSAAVDPVATDATVGAAVVDGPALDAAAIGVAIDAAADATTAAPAPTATESGGTAAPTGVASTPVDAAAATAVADPAVAAKADAGIAPAGAPAAAPEGQAAAAAETRTEPAPAAAATVAPTTNSVRPGRGAAVPPASATPHAAVEPHAAVDAEKTTRHHASVTASDRTAAAASEQRDGYAAEHHDALDLATTDAEATAGAAEPKREHARIEVAPSAARGSEAARLPASAGPAPDAAQALPPGGVDGAKPESVTRTPAAPAPAAGGHASDVVPRWSERVTDAIRLSSARDGGEIRLQLEPEGLGHIDVRLHLHGDGVRAVIVAEHESTRALLTSQQQVLEQAFARSDLRLAGFSVDVGSGHGSALPDAPAPHDGEAGTAQRGTSAASESGDRGELAAAAPAEGRVSVRV